MPMKNGHPDGIDFAKYGEIYAKALLRDSQMEPGLLPDLVFDAEYCQLSYAHKKAVQRAVKEVAKALLTINGYNADHIIQ